MRLMPVAVAVLIAASSVSTPAVADNDQLVASICDYVKSNDKNRLRKKLKESRVKLRNIYTGVSCDGASLLRTAYNANSFEVGEYIAKRLPAGDLSSPEADGKSILDWANSNGHSGSAITAAVQDRINSGE